MPRQSDITKYVLSHFEALDNESAVNLSELAESLKQEFPQNFPNKTSASNRINRILEQDHVKMFFRKVKGKNRKPYVIRTQQIMEFKW